jgi:hypothetical protein
VGSQQDAVGQFGFVLADDVDAVERGSLVVLRLEFLFDDGQAVTFEFAAQPGGAFFVAVGIGHARTEINLFLDVHVRGVFMEGRYCHLGHRGFGHVGAVGHDHRFVFDAGCKGKDGYQKNW